MHDPRFKADLRHTRVAGAPHETASTSDFDLIDVGVVLWRRRTLVVVIFLVIQLIGAGAAFFVTPTYTYFATLSLGTVVANDGSRFQIIVPATALQALKAVYIPTAISSVAADRPDMSGQVRALNVEANASTDSNAVVLSCATKEKYADNCVAVEKLAMSLFIQDNSGVITIAKAGLQTQLVSEINKLKALQNPAEMTIKRLAAEESVSAAKNALASLNAKAGELSINIEKLKTSMSLYQAEQVELEKHIASSEQNSTDAAKHAATPTDALANLLLNSELQRSLDRLSDVKQKLNVEVPNQLADFEAQLANNARAQESQQQIIAGAMLGLQKIEFTHEQDVEAQQSVVDKIRSQLNNVQENRILGLGVRAPESSGLGRLALVAISFVFSILFALFAVFATEYFSQVRLRVNSTQS